MSKRSEQRQREKGARIMAYLTSRNFVRWSPEARKAVEQYPALGCVTESGHVLTCARVLDALPEDDRSLALDLTFRQNQDVLAALAEVPPMPGRNERLRADAELAQLIAVIEANSTPYRRQDAA